MALPSSRNTTYAPGSPVLSADLNDVQDYLSQAWLSSTAQFVLADGLKSAPTTTGTTAAAAVYDYDRGVTWIFSYTSGAPTAYVQPVPGWGGGAAVGSGSVGSLTNLNAIGGACYYGGIAVCGIGYSAGSATRILRSSTLTTVTSPVVSSHSLGVSGTSAPHIVHDGARFVAGDSTGAVWRSADGSTWTAGASVPAGASFSNGVVAFNRNANAVVVAATAGFGVSTDGGATWSNVATKPASGVVSVAYDNETRTYWCATISTVYRGTTKDSLSDWVEVPWSQLVPPLPSVTGAALFAARGVLINDFGTYQIANMGDAIGWRVASGPMVINQFTRHGWLGMNGTALVCGGPSL